MSSLFFNEHTPDPGPLNREVELAVKANSFASSVFPKPGELIVGERGLEFRASSGVGFIQIPWVSIEKIVCDVMGSYVRAIDVYTEDAGALNFVVSDGANLLRALAKHVGREKLEASPQNLKNAPKNVVKSIASKFKKPGDGDTTAKE